jgi:hypothetical protein
MPIPTILAEARMLFTEVVSPSPDVLLIVGFIAIVLAVAFLMTASQNRRSEPEDRPRLCRSCALSHPPFANYCRRCGRRL